VFVRSDTITVTEGDGSEATWTRRAETNLFDTVTRRPAGDEVVGVAALVGVGAQAIGATLVRFLVLFHRRGDEVTVMGGSFSDDGNTAGEEAGFSTSHIQAVESTDVSNAAPGPSWTAR
jgi:hypothetical protein